MDCPQCGGTLVTYALSDREASVCEDCGYVGIAAEHRGDSRTIESWDDAIRRFYRAHDSDSTPSVDLQPPLSRPASSAAETWDDALRRFYARQGRDTDDERDDDGATDDERDDDGATDDERDADSADSTDPDDAAGEDEDGDEDENEPPTDETARDAADDTSETEADVGR